MQPNDLGETTIRIHQLEGEGTLLARVQAQPLEWKLHWLLRIGVFMEFVGHGAFGVKTKAAWLAYFHVFAIPDELAWRLMPVVGTIDIVLGLLILFLPCRGALLYMTIWGVFTALLRPAANEGWWEFFERSYNYGGPAALLLLHGLCHGAKSWFQPLRVVPRLNLERSLTFLWIFRGTVALMLIGHGGFGAFLAKKNLLGFYQAAGFGAFGMPLETWRAGVGFFEMGLGVTALFTFSPRFFGFVCAWKLASEFLFVVAGANGAWWEVIERGGSYMIPLAAVCLLLHLKTRTGDEGVLGGLSLTEQNYKYAANASV